MKQVWIPTVCEAKRKVKEVHQVILTPRKVTGNILQGAQGTRALTCAATLLVRIEAMCALVTRSPSYTWYTVTLAFLCTLV